MPVAPLVEPGPALTAAQLSRYSRNIRLAELGELGQRRLTAARVCVLGAGGLGAPILLYLAAAGVGTIGVVDDDTVELSNLQRQVIHDETDVGAFKAQSAANSIMRLSSDVTVKPHVLRLTEANIRAVFEQYDLVIDGTDNFATRYLVSDTCADLGIPLIWGSILRFDAQVSVFWSRPPDGSGIAPITLRDLYPDPPPEGTVESCATAGVLGAMCGQVGSVMAAEAVKLITGIGEPLIGRVLALDALTAQWSDVRLRPNPESRDTAATASRPSESSHPSPRAATAIAAEDLHRKLTDREAGNETFLLIDVREPHENQTGAIPGSVLLPLGELLTENGRARIDPDVPVVVYCHSGARSDRAAETLTRAGHHDVRSLVGGYESWSVRCAHDTPTR